MKPFQILLISCVLLGLLSCKKDADITMPTELQDFSGLYNFQGNIEIQSNPIEEIPFQWVVTDANNGNGYQVTNSPYTYTSSAYRWTIGEIRNSVPGYGYFRLIVYGGQLITNDVSDSNWKVNELDDIFQAGKQLDFGTNFGQVGIEFDADDRPYGTYWDLWADNSNNKVTIEEVNDLKTYLPERKWAKQVVVSFDVHLQRFPVTGSPDIELKNCRASLFFSPNVE